MAIWDLSSWISAFGYRFVSGIYRPSPTANCLGRVRCPLDVLLRTVSVRPTHLEFFILQDTMNIFRGVLCYSMLTLSMIFACAAPVRAAREEVSGSIQQMMTPAEFKAAGLNKLSPEELQKLDAWLQGYREVAEKTAEKKATARAERTKMDLLVSRVDGTFNGLTGRTLIRLEDGTVWKQANADDRYRPKVTDHPAAAVIHGIFGYKMQIEGTQEFYVDPVRNP
jgi:hypothetical protein